MYIHDKESERKLLDKSNVVVGLYRKVISIKVFMVPDMCDLYLYTSLRLPTVLHVMGSEKYCITNTRNGQKIKQSEGKMSSAIFTVENFFPIYLI